MMTTPRRAVNSDSDDDDDDDNDYDNDHIFVTP